MFPQQKCALAFSLKKASYPVGYKKTGGDGGNRTRVRKAVTKNLYMLILLIESRFCWINKQSLQKPARKGSSASLGQKRRYSHLSVDSLKLRGRA